jgi:hypothetical protein
MSASKQQDRQADDEKEKKEGVVPASTGGSIYWLFTASFVLGRQWFVSHLHMGGAAAQELPVAGQNPSHPPTRAVLL